MKKVGKLFAVAAFATLTVALAVAVTGCRRETPEQINVFAGFGLTTSNFNSIVSAGGTFGGWNADNYELSLMWSDSTQANFHATLNAINASGNGNGTVQEYQLFGRTFRFARTERWELVWEDIWENVEEDVGLMIFRIYAISPLSP